MRHIPKVAALVSVGTVAALVLAGCAGGNAGGGEDRTTLVASHPQELHHLELSRGGR